MDNIYKAAKFSYNLHICIEILKTLEHRENELKRSRGIEHATN